MAGMTARERAKATATKATATKRTRSDPLVKAKQEADVARLWIAGANLSEIAKATELSYATVKRIRRELLNRAIGERDKAVDELKERELLTLDRLQRAHFSAAVKGSIGSAKIVLDCVGRRAKMLGLDAPIKVDATVKSELDAQIESLVEELEGQGLVKASTS